MVLHMHRHILETGNVSLFESTDRDRYADGDQVRDFYYVKDAAARTCDFLHTDVSGLFNIGFGTPHTWNELARAVFAAMGREPSITYVPMPADLAGRYQNYTCADMSKLQRALPYTNAYTFEGAVADYVQNYLEPGETW